MQALCGSDESLRCALAVTGTCIIVSPYFPPSSLAGVHRARLLAKHLPSTGWTPIVVCVDERFHEERLDPELSSLVPNTVEVVKTGAIPPRWTRAVKLGDISLRGFLHLRSSICRLLSERQIDVCLVTGSPYYQMLLSREIRRRFGVPVVLDFQDPWASAWGAAQPRFSKSGAAHMLSVLLEPRALRDASYVTTVSEVQNAELRQRHPWLDGDRMSAHPIGADPEDFVALRSASMRPDSVALDGSKINLSYVGTVWPPAMHPLRVLLEAAARFARSRPDLASRLQINFIGTSNQPSEFRRLSVMPLAEEAGVASLVREVPQRIPFLDSLSLLTKSDGILMFGSLEPHYTASKVYSNLIASRPYLSMFHRESSAHSVLQAAGGGIALAFSTPGELEGLRSEICEGLERLVERPESLGTVDRAAYRAYEASSIAREYGRIFDRLKAEHREAR